MDRLDSREAIAAQLERRLAMADTNPSMLNLSEAMAIAAINHGIDTSAFNVPATRATEEAAAIARSGSNLAVNASTGELSLELSKPVLGPWVELHPPRLDDIPAEIPIYRSQSGACCFDKAEEWLEEMAWAIGWLKVRVRSTGKNGPTEFQFLIVDGTPLAERAKGRDWTELIRSCTEERHFLAFAQWLKSASNTQAVVTAIQERLAA